MTYKNRCNFIISHPKRFEVRGICTQRYQKADSSFIEVLTISPKTKKYIHPVLQGPGIDLSEVEMKTDKELKEMSFWELNAELKKAVDELGKELKALGKLS